MQAKAIKILIVDDELDLLKTVSEVFQLFGFTVETATSGNEAWQKLQSTDYDLVISDVRMENGTGIELLKLCKERDPENPKFLVMSGFTDYSEAELYDLGVDGFFAKPFDANAVRIAIKESLLALNALWGTHRSPRIKHHYHKKLESFDKAISTGELQFGRRGFFMRMNMDFPEEGQIISFEFENSFASPHSNVSGYGKVLWVRSKSKANEENGIGVIIQHIDDNSIKSFIHWLEQKKYISLIPFGYKHKV